MRKSPALLQFTKARTDAVLRWAVVERSAAHASQKQI